LRRLRARRHLSASADFLSAKLGLKGGTPRAVIPYLKKIGLIGSDGVPTELYRRFRNPTESGAAIAEAIRRGYKSLYEMNEYVHELSDKDLKGLLVQATGLEEKSPVIYFIQSTFKNLKSFADFEQKLDRADTADASNGLDTPDGKQRQGTEAAGVGVNLGYTINLNLPATSDVAVFNAIFKSLKEHLLKNV
jgi:hypothetical protein